MDDLKRVLPTDIRPQWLNIIRRMQSVSRRNNGLGIVTMSIVVNQDGLPMFWSEPKITLIEPKGCADVIIQTLSNSD